MKLPLSYIHTCIQTRDGISVSSHIHGLALEAHVSSAGIYAATDTHLRPLSITHKCKAKATTLQEAQSHTAQVAPPHTHTQGGGGSSLHWKKSWMESQQHHPAAKVAQRSLSGPQFPHLSNGDKGPHPAGFWGCCEAESRVSLRRQKEPVSPKVLASQQSQKRS